ncbi:MAG: DUF1700 domain-containing protein [Eubacteriales bacterium]|nr:DUF1700 domain-containing protein [Eubacteriales bacterium]
MDRAIFMEQLERLLSDLSEEERQEALDYYESYFDDAGEDQEAAVIRELGSPGKVAAIIKADLKESNDKFAEYTEWGYEDTRMKEQGQMPDKYTAVSVGNGCAKDGGKDDADRSKDARDNGRANGDGWEETGSPFSGTGRRSWRERAGQSSEGNAWGRDERGERARSRAERGYHAEKKKSSGKVILLLILLVFISPFLKGAVGGIIGVIVTIALLPFLIIFGLGAAVLALVIAGIVCVAGGIGACFTNPAGGVLTIGIGCLIMAVGILLLILLIWAAGRLLPRLIRAFTGFCNNLLHRERKDGAGA